MKKLTNIQEKEIASKYGVVSKKELSREYGITVGMIISIASKANRTTTFKLTEEIEERKKEVKETVDAILQIIFGGQHISAEKNQRINDFWEFCHSIAIHRCISHPIPNYTTTSFDNLDLSLFYS